MKSHLSIKITCCLLFIVFHHSAVAQKMRKQDCYTNYKKQGDAYVVAKNYDLAIQQYQNAKYCNLLTTTQRRILDSLITDAGRRRQMTMKKTVIRRY